MVWGSVAALVVWRNSDLSESILESLQREGVEELLRARLNGERGSKFQAPQTAPEEGTSIGVFLCARSAQVEWAGRSHPSSSSASFSPFIPLCAYPLPRYFSRTSTCDRSQLAPLTVCPCPLADSENVDLRLPLQSTHLRREPLRQCRRYRRRSPSRQSFSFSAQACLLLRW